MPKKIRHVNISFFFSKSDYSNVLDIMDRIIEYSLFSSAVHDLYLLKGCITLHVHVRTVQLRLLMNVYVYMNE